MSNPRFVTLGFGLILGVVAGGLAVTILSLFDSGNNVIPGIEEPALADFSEADTATIRELVSRLDLEQYKTTLRGLTAFGDRQWGTERNRDAVDWIEARLQEFGCTNTERLTYVHPALPLEMTRPPAPAPAPVPAPPPSPDGVRRNGNGPGGSVIFGNRAPTGVNRDPMAQPDERIRELNMERPVDGEQQQVYCTKVGTTRPDQMYIVGAHMDEHGYNEAVNDNGSGTALVMELARILNSPDVETDVSIRFVLWNNEETGLNGSRAYVDERQALQGIEDPPGSGVYPEPTWVGMIQHARRDRASRGGANLAVTRSAHLERIQRLEPAVETQG